MIYKSQTRKNAFENTISVRAQLGREFIVTSIGLLVAIFSAMPLYAQSGYSACGSLKNGYGPYDYRTDRDKLPIVTGAHFTEVVEALIRGTTNTRPGGDIDYTLRAIPNNHRALMAMMRLGEKEKTTQPSGSSYSIECWFERAILFRPDDGIVRMIYSTYLNRNGRIPDATRQLEIATTYAKDSAVTHYNIGLHYFDLKNYDKAIIQAHKAMALGWMQTELRDQLRGVSKWTEPVDLQATPATDSASAPASK
ncbi:tetratricopeptide repeat protein [Rhodoferax ferrireducens]|uniref:tetratricopeptide repeat protein n=1 Tax=Rhodoferax ferrireducens TaxID=192843 RepID=UPI000E0CD612|nr:tetratricopeptide repeat protein [Rhodoferax ferrireducens]